MNNNCDCVSLFSMRCSCRDNTRIYTRTRELMWLLPLSIDVHNHHCSRSLLFLSFVLSKPARHTQILCMCVCVHRSQLTIIVETVCWLFFEWVNVLFVCYRMNEQRNKMLNERTFVCCWWCRSIGVMRIEFDLCWHFLIVSFLIRDRGEECLLLFEYRLELY